MTNIASTKFDTLEEHINFLYNDYYEKVGVPSKYLVLSQNKYFRLRVELYVDYPGNNLIEYKGLKIVIIQADIVEVTANKII